MADTLVHPRALLLALLAIAASAQIKPVTVMEDTKLAGRVLDPSRSPVVGAKISAVAEGGTTGSSAVSGQSGDFSLPLTPGRYTVKISAEGFQQSAVNVELPRAGVENREFVLRIAGVRASVTVTESPDYGVSAIYSGTKTLTLLRDVPQSITVVPGEQVKDQMMMSIADVVRYVPGITAHQGENNRDQVVIRGNSSSADFFVDGVRDDVQYYRDFYNLDRLEALKGPNAMIFGRGGGGGVINRVTKEAGFMPLREVTIQGGSYGDRRFTADVDQTISDKLAFRLNGVYENSHSFRDFVNLERFGVNPTLTIAAGQNTKAMLSYEHFGDDRAADRGIPSFRRLPADVAISTYYGNPEDSRVRARVNLGSATVEHQAGGLNIRNRTHFGGYDRGYRNYVPGAVTPDGGQVALSAYENATTRLNIFNQTDLTCAASTGRVHHTLLGGAEAGRQRTDNFRNTGYFDNSATTILIPYSQTIINTPVTFRQSATDADNHIGTNLVAAYLQDQIDFTSRLQVVAGLRLDHFDLRYHNNRNGGNLRRIDNMLSPRAGVVFKAAGAVSLYGNYSVSYLPSSGDQFSSLTVITQQMKPEKFTNYEAGIKWDAARGFSLTAAAYRLDRTNTRSIAPDDPTRIVQTGSQRSNGVEIGTNGGVTRMWRISGGYAYQDASIMSATAVAPGGARVAQVPRHSFSLWNNFQLIRRLGMGFGIVNRTDMYAAIDNTVVLPGYTRADAALFYSLTERVRLQTNVENLFDRKYYANADGNNNISPGFPRSVRVGLTARF